MEKVLLFPNYDVEKTYKYIIFTTNVIYKSSLSGNPNLSKINPIKILFDKDKFTESEATKLGISFAYKVKDGKFGVKPKYISEWRDENEGVEFSEDILIEKSNEWFGEDVFTHKHIGNNKWVDVFQEPKVKEQLSLKFGITIK
jgi:hypothetical protein